uniref:Uncharacterized protein n=1 Tax=Otolemur garnettii TaxID=30611 RepID=H0XRN9_OTOGA
SPCSHSFIPALAPGHLLHWAFPLLRLESLIYLNAYYRCVETAVGAWRKEQGVLNSAQ